MSKHSRSKKSMAGQYVLSFLLFVMISVLTLSLCAKVYIANPNTIAGVFTSKEYVTALHNDIKQFAKDECDKCSVPSDFIDSVVSYDRIYNIEAAFINSALGTSQSYSDEAYEKNVQDLEEKLKDSVDKELANQGLKSSVKDGSDLFARSIAKYTMQKAEFRYIDKLQTVLNLGNAAITVIVVLSAIITVGLTIILFFKNEKRYRSLKMIVFSFEASALFSFALVGAAAIVRAIKDLVVYPTYLCSAIMRYVDSSMLVVFLSGVVWLVVSVVITTIIWRLKRGND